MRIFHPADPAELAKAKVVLEGAGISFLVRNENYFNTAGELLSLADTEVWVEVPAEEAERARELLKNWSGH